MKSEGLYQLLEGIGNSRTDASGAIYYLRILSSVVHPKDYEMGELRSRLGFADYRDIECFYHYHNYPRMKLDNRRDLNKSPLRDFLRSVESIGYFLKFDFESFNRAFTEAFRPIVEVIEEDIKKCLDENSLQSYSSLLGAGWLLGDDNQHTSARYSPDHWLYPRDTMHRVLVFHLLLFAMRTVEPENITDELRDEYREFMERVSGTYLLRGY